VAIGLSGLIGWMLYIETLLTWGAAQAIAPNSAACMVLAGAPFWLLRKEGDQPLALAMRLTAKTAAAIVGLVGFLRLAEDIFGADFRIDRLFLVTAPAARPLMSTVAAGAFVLVALALLGIDGRTRRGDWPSQFLCSGAMMGAFLGFLGLVLDPSVSPITLALPTFVSFFALATGLLCSRPAWAVGGLLASLSQGARLSRRAIPVALLALTVVGFSISKPLLTDARFTWVQVSALAVFSSALLGGFITWVAFILERARRTEEKSRKCCTSATSSGAS